MLFDICEQHSLHLDRELEYGGRKYLEKRNRILMKQKIVVWDRTPSAKEAEFQVVVVSNEDMLILFSCLFFVRKLAAFARFAEHLDFLAIHREGWNI